MRTQIVYEDNDVLVIYKPAGFPTQTAKVGQADVVSELKNYIKDPSHYIAVIHRLDQPVEGLLVFGKNKQAAAALTAQLQNSKDEVGLNKQYLTVFSGKPDSEQGTLMDYMYKDKDGKSYIVKGADIEKKGAKKAVLHYEVKKSVILDSKDVISLAKVEIETGRYHQIRTQMSAAGMSLLGDAKYADAETMELSTKLGVRTVALCANRLEFVHPKTKKALCFEVEPKGMVFGIF